jgi:hypothetical protein
MRGATIATRITITTTGMPRAKKRGLILDMEMGGV